MNSEKDPEPALCAAGCGFYGNPATRNLCSLCYCEFLKKNKEAGQVPNSCRLRVSDTNFIDRRCEGPNPCQTATDNDASDPQEPQTSSSSEAQHPATQDPDAAVTHEAPSPIVEVGYSAAESPAASRAERTASSEPEPTSAGDEEAPKKNSRCLICQKRLGLLGFQCRCGDWFCTQHRHPESHDCTFDYKTYERNQLQRDNQRVVAEKIQKF